MRVRVTDADIQRAFEIVRGEPRLAESVAAMKARTSPGEILRAMSFRPAAVCGACLLLSALIGCAAHRSEGSSGPVGKIELLGFPGCPNTPAMRANLREALADAAAFDDVNQNALPGSDPRRGWPTPTILIDGRDLFGLPAPTGPAMGCRLYPGGVPTAAEIRSALASRHAGR